MNKKILLVAIALFPIFSGLALAQGANFENPLDFDTVEGFLENFLTYLQGIIAVIALIFIVIGAIMYITSTGESGRTEQAKATITYAMIGLAIAIAAPSFLREISGILGWTEGEAAAGDALSLTEIAMNVLNFLLAVVGVLSMIMLVVGGVMYVTSAGDEDRIDTGKKIVKYSIIGIIVALTSLVIVKQIALVIGG